ncbi:MAG: hypothetical protein RL173_2120 [Fibrobacterota bacterium]|jgi:hypothetical protein
MIQSISVAILQILALSWMGYASLDIMRKQTMAKNMPWVLEHPDFLRRHHRADSRWLVSLSAVCIALVVAGPWVFPTILVVHVKNAAILAVVSVLCVVHPLQEKRIGDSIPKMMQRSASLRKRSTGDYAPKWLRWSADGAFAAMCLAFGVTFLVGSVPTSFALAVGISIAVAAVSMGWGRWAAISEKSPHFQQVRMVSDKDLSENYRRFAVRLMLILQLYIVGFLALILVFQIQGTPLVQNPFQDMLANWLGEANGHPPVLSYAQYDVVLSLATIPLFLYIPFNQAFADIRKIDLLGLVQKETP